jgi:hypothetical protein
MVVVGGLGSIVGSVVGAVVIVGVLEGLRAFRATQEILFGAILIAFVVFWPRGIAAFLQRFRGCDEPLSSFDRARHLQVDSPSAHAQGGPLHESAEED